MVEMGQGKRQNSTVEIGQGVGQDCMAVMGQGNERTAELKQDKG